jgi:hypothetical protein
MIWAGLFVVGRLYADSKLGVRVVPGTNGVNLANDRINQVNASLDEISLARALGRVHRVANEKSEFLFTTCPGPHLQHDELDPAPWLMRTTAGSKKKFRFFFNDVWGSNESWITQISEQTRGHVLTVPVGCWKLEGLRKLDSSDSDRPIRPNETNVGTPAGPGIRWRISRAPLFSQSFMSHPISTSRFIYLYVMFRYNFSK